MPVELSSSGLQTFLRERPGTVEDVAHGTVAVFGAPTDWTLGTRPGARYGPRAIRASSTQLAYYLGTARGGQMLDVRTDRTLGYDASDFPLVDLSDVAIYPVDVERTGASISAMTSAILERNGVPIMLGGDHYVSFPAVRAATECAEARGKRIGFIQVDAHLDLVDDNPIFGRHYHGSLTRRIAELPAIDPRNMAWIGINGYVRLEQLEFVKESGSWMATRQEVRRRGISAVVEEAVSRASDGCDAVYLSVDIDAVDGGSAAGAGSINVDGLTPGEFLDCLDLLSDAPLCGADLVEVSPLLDETEYTARLAAVSLTALVLRRAGTQPLAS